jgi:hypothetical protein
MQKISFPILFSVVLLSSAALAQTQTPEPPDTIGHPPPLPGPPPVADPSATKPGGPAATTAVSEPAPKGYMGAYAPPGTPPKPYSTGPLPSQSSGPGLNVVAQDGTSTRTVRAVPCGAVARETDGFTTCVGIPEQDPQSKKR